MTLFHQRWWLDAVAPSDWDEVTVSEQSTIVARLPYYGWHRYGLRVLGMPPLTRTLGPLLFERSGKPHRRAQRDMEIVEQLLAKLPRHALFVQTLPTEFRSILPFQKSGFSTSCEALFEIDASLGCNKLWSELPTKTRTMLRNCQRLFDARECTDIDEFVGLFSRNFEHKPTASYYAPDFLRRVIEASQCNQSGAILALYDESKNMRAAIFVAWACGRMHFLLQSRDPDMPGGAIGLLLWTAIEKAAEQNLIVDLCGISNAKAAQRLSQFGGELRYRTRIVRGIACLAAARSFLRELRWQIGRRHEFI